MNDASSLCLGFFMNPALLGGKRGTVTARIIRQALGAGSIDLAATESDAILTA